MWSPWLGLICATPIKGKLLVCPENISLGNGRDKHSSLLCFTKEKGFVTVRLVSLDSRYLRLEICHSAFLHGDYNHEPAHPHRSSLP
jgi:hypothetical protein